MKRLGLRTLMISGDTAGAANAVGSAMGGGASDGHGGQRGGTDAAMQAADITLLRGDLSLVAEAIDISRRTHAKIRQNLFWAFAYNVIGIPLAALGLLSPVVAGAAMAASSVSVIGNALLPKRSRAPRRGAAAGHRRRVERLT